MMDRYTADGPMESEVFGFDLTGMAPGLVDEPLKVWNDAGKAMMAQIAARYGVPPGNVGVVETLGEIRRRVADRIDPIVLEVALGQPATTVWWRVTRDDLGDGDGHYAPTTFGGEVDSYGPTTVPPVSYVMDDPGYGPPADLGDLRYDPEVGLHRADDARTGGRA